jgi:hypothetical protein
VSFADKWNRDLAEREFVARLPTGDWNFALAYGRAKLLSEGEFTARRQESTIFIEGTVTHTFADDYDFHPEQPGAEGALVLQQYGGARPFHTEAKWHQRVRATVQYRNGRLFHPRVEWGATYE